MCIRDRLSEHEDGSLWHLAKRTEACLVHPPFPPMGIPAGRPTLVPRTGTGRTVPDRHRIPLYAIHNTPPSDLGVEKHLGLTSNYGSAYILLPPRVVVDLDDRSAGLDHVGNPRKNKHRTETIPAGLETTYSVRVAVDVRLDLAQA